MPISEPSESSISSGTSGVVCTGGQVLAKSDVSLSSSAELDKEVVRVLFSTMQTGECLTINVGKSELQGNFDEEEFLVTDPIMGEIWLTKKMKEYNLFEDNTETFFKFATERFDASGIITICSDNKCNERQIFPSERTERDFDTFDECNENIVSIFQIVLIIVGVIVFIALFTGVTLWLIIRSRKKHGKRKK